ncbi:MULTISPECIES: glycoside hydrolase family 125 protein [Saccharibacillus]|uniref:glycoside hydrolase family 125 protein n=1 Tax=Saccharibacillus TaxID=456492 RepID=UPI001239838B|nr:glycoside hydrolase family 125 protein [Saccharibacillus sp. WB 17]MWJ30537.1 glycoside hydrolase family 125 protein [Saccharibacillus sp. WB 17]
MNEQKNKIIPLSVERLIADVTEKLGTRTKLACMFGNCIRNTLTTTLRPQQDGTVFVITGDIPAMWLRDSAAQVRPYLLLANEDEAISDLVKGVVQRQIRCILHDPYANAFNESANGSGHQDDRTEMTPWIWERKYEIDSLCYPLQLAYLLWQKTGRTDHFDDEFRLACLTILDVWRTEQHHGEESGYRFERLHGPASDTLPHAGRGNPVVVTGMTWSGFRPSDDACEYGYLIPANLFAVVVLDCMQRIASDVYEDAELSRSAAELQAEIRGGVERHGIVDHPEFGPMYAYETDGKGNYNLMDDANVPSLLSLPYFGYGRADDELYVNTRRFILSEHNPYYYSGTAAQGIGSPHTPPRYIWHISLAMQALTSTDREERGRLLLLLENTDADTGFLHEGFHADDPAQYTREWFSWANALFSELVLTYCGYDVPGMQMK